MYFFQPRALNGLRKTTVMATTIHARRTNRTWKSAYKEPPPSSALGSASLFS